MTAHVETAAAPVLPVRPVAPAIFLPLFAPYGISNGYVVVTLAFLLSRAGLSTVAVAGIISASVWPQTWKILWAPLIDTVGDPRWWYGLGAIVTGATLLLLSTLPATARELPVLSGLVVLSSVASTLVSMSSEIVMTHGVTDRTRGAASGWGQAGNVGGSGIGGGLGLLLAEHASRPWVSGAVLAALCVACWAAMLAFPRVERARPTTGYLAGLAGVARDV